MSRTLTSYHLPLEIKMKLGIAPRKSSGMCSLIAVLGETKRGPREGRQTQIDRGGTHRIHGVVQFQAHRLGRVQLPCNTNQRFGELAVQPSVASLVDIGQIAAREVAAQS